MGSKISVSVDPICWVLMAFWLVLIPLPWLCAGLVSVAVHECSHWLMVKLTGGTLHGIHIRPTGVLMDTGMMDQGKEWICALAGPVGELTLLLLANVFPRTAICALFHGIFNLMPLYPLDGGRVVCALYGFPVGRKIGDVFCFLCVLGAIYLGWRWNRMDLGLIFAGTMLIQRRYGKIPCKAGQ